MNSSIAFLKNKWVEKGFQKYLKNTSWMFGTRILTMVISFLATIYIARNLGPTNFGQFSYALSFTALFGFISSLGIDGILYRDLIRFPEKKRVLLGTALLIRLCSGTLTALLISIIAVFFTENDVSRLLILILAGTFILNAFQIISFEFQARADSKYPSIVTLVMAVCLNALKIISIAMGKGVIYLALILLLESILYALSYLYIHNKKTHESILQWSFEKKYASSLLMDSMPLIALSAFSIIYARIDQVFIKHLIDATAVGIYDSAVRLTEVWTFIPGLLVAALYPAIVNAKKVSEDMYNKRLISLALTLIILAFLAAMGMTLLAPYIIPIIYGTAFIAGVSVLKVYIWSFIGTSLGIFITQYLITENHKKILIAISFIPMLLNVALNLLWIPQYGIKGAAYATVLSYSLIPLLLLFFKSTRHRLILMYKSFS